MDAVIWKGMLALNVVVKNGTLSEAEQQWCVDYVQAQFPGREIDAIELLCGDKGVMIRYTLGHCYFHKMGGYFIGDPSAWNDAKRAEDFATKPNPID